MQWVLLYIRTQLQQMTSDSEEVTNSETESPTEKNPLKKVKKTINKAKGKITLNISDCQYPVVKRVAKGFGWKTNNSPETTDWDVWWTDNAVQPETLLRMEPHQKINHFPGMFNLARKNLMGRYLMKMRKQFPDEYCFFPLTWMLPVEYHELKSYFESKPKGKARTFIVKPEAMSQGKGIFLTRKLQDIQQNSHCVVQRYLHRPYLVEGLKFDLRVYVLVASVDPLRLFIFNEGLARFATEKYEPPTKDNMEDVCMHLTNYAINKDNPKFVFNENSNDMTKGHKRSLSWFYSYLQEHEPKSIGLREKVEDLIVKTMISGLPTISNQYRSCQPENFASNMCFQLLGFDIILTDKCEPLLLQINHTPSFSTDTPLDNTIKTNFIRDSLTLMNINEKTKNKIIQQRREACQQRVITGKKVKLTSEEKEAERKKAMMERDKFQDNNLGGLKKIYPVLDQQKMKIYQQFHDFSYECYLISTGTKKLNVTRKAEKSESAFGTCFTKKPKQSLGKASTNPKMRPSIDSQKNNNLLFNRKYASKKQVPASEICNNQKEVHSYNLISPKNAEIEATDNEQIESEDPKSPNSFYPVQISLTPHTSSVNTIPKPPQLKHTHSSKDPQSIDSEFYDRHGRSDPHHDINIHGSPERSPLEETEQYFSKNKIEDNYNRAKQKNLNFGYNFQQKERGKQVQSFRQVNIATINQYKFPGQSVKNVDILFQHPETLGGTLNGNRKIANNSHNGRAGFQGFRNALNKMGPTADAEKDRRKNKTPHLSTNWETKQKSRNMSNREKIPILLNTLLINGSEGASSAVSANNLRKILNNK